MEQIIINIFESYQEDGYVYDIYDSETAFQNGDDSLDGGICTGSMDDAIEMACLQAKDLIANYKKTNDKQ